MYSWLPVLAPGCLYSCGAGGCPAAGSSLVSVAPATDRARCPVETDCSDDHGDGEPLAGAGHPPSHAAARANPARPAPPRHRNHRFVPKPCPGRLPVLVWLPRPPRPWWAIIVQHSETDRTPSQLPRILSFSGQSSDSPRCATITKQQKTTHT